MKKRFLYILFFVLCMSPSVFAESLPANIITTGNGVTYGSSLDGNNVKTYTSQQGGMYYEKSTTSSVLKSKGDVYLYTPAGSTSVLLTPTSINGLIKSYDTVNNDALKKTNIPVFTESQTTDIANYNDNGTISNAENQGQVFVSSNTIPSQLTLIPAEKDEDGHYTSGYMYLTGQNGNLGFQPFCGVFQGNWKYIYIKSFTQSNNDCYIFGVNGDGVSYAFYQLYDSSGVYMNSAGTSRLYDIASNGDISLKYSGYTFNANSPNFHTNLPIFKDTDTDAIENYIESGDISGADNYDDLQPKPSLSDDIPKPNKITLTNQSLDQQQNIFVNNVEFTVHTEDLSGITGTIEGDYFVSLNLLRHQQIPGATQDTILSEGNEHTSSWVVAGNKTYNGDGTYNISIPAQTLNNYVSKIYSDNGLVGDGGSSSYFSQIYLNQLTISARNEYIQGDEFVVGSWSNTYNFTYNYMTKSASGYDSPVPNNPEDATEVPNVTPNDNTDNGYNNNNGNNTSKHTSKSKTIRNSIKIIINSVFHFTIFRK